MFAGLELQHAMRTGFCSRSLAAHLGLSSGLALTAPAAVAGPQGISMQPGLITGEQRGWGAAASQPQGMPSLHHLYQVGALHTLRCQLPWRVPMSDQILPFACVGAPACCLHTSRSQAGSRMLPPAQTDHDLMLVTTWADSSLLQGVG